jgi:hypothetical protein
VKAGETASSSRATLARSRPTVSASRLPTALGEEHVALGRAPAGGDSDHVLGRLAAEPHARSLALVGFARRQRAGRQRAEDLHPLEGEVGGQRSVACLRAGGVRRPSLADPPETPS